MDNISTELGKIYCKYNKEEDCFDMYRVANIIKESNDIKYLLLAINNETYHFYDDENEFMIIDEKRYNKFKIEYDLLKSEGIVSLSNIISVKNETREIKDILLIYFPKNRVTKMPDINQPYIVARQGINNIFAEMAGELDKVGLSITLDTLPAGYALSDFITNDGVNNSRLCHVYKTDSSFDLNMLLNNEESESILKELFEQRVFYLSNTKPDFIKEKYKYENLCLDGYCNTLHKFLLESGFMEDLLNRMGISIVDIDLQDNKELNDEEKLLLITLYGGIKINKAVPLRFSYEINLNAIKMKYLLVSTLQCIDKESELYIIPYTEFSDEVDIYSLYKLTEERTIQLQERLLNCVKAYDQKLTCKN